MKVVLASKNQHKLVEIAQILKPLGIELVLQSQLGLDIDVDETGTTFEENSFLKAEAVMKASGLPALADDSGIEADALGGEPGIYSARYGGDPSMNDWDRLLLLLKNMEGVPDEKRTGRFVSVITLVFPDGHKIQARGTVEGYITHEAHGGAGFGYDPIFYYPPYGKTFGEATAEEKNLVSHRANALKLFYDKLIEEKAYVDK